MLKNKRTLIFPVTLLILSAAFFFIPEQQMFHGPTICLYQTLFHVECWGCGMTRALWLFLHGRFLEAHQFNWRVWVVVPIFAGFAIQLTVRTIRKLRDLQSKL